MLRGLCPAGFDSQESGINISPYPSDIPVAFDVELSQSRLEDFVSWAERCCSEGEARATSVIEAVERSLQSDDSSIPGGDLNRHRSVHSGYLNQPRSASPFRAYYRAHERDKNTHDNNSAGDPYAGSFGYDRHEAPSQAGYNGISISSATSIILKEDKTRSDVDLDRLNDDYRTLRYHGQTRFRHGHGQRRDLVPTQHFSPQTLSNTIQRDAHMRRRSSKKSPSLPSDVPVPHPSMAPVGQTLSHTIGRNFLLPEYTAQTGNWEVLRAKLPPHFKHITFNNDVWTINPFVFDQIRLYTIPGWIANRPVILLYTPVTPMFGSGMQDPTCGDPTLEIDPSKPLRSEHLKSLFKYFPRAMSASVFFNGRILMNYAAELELNRDARLAPPLFGSLKVDLVISKPEPTGPSNRSEVEQQQSNLEEAMSEMRIRKELNQGSTKAEVDTCRRNLSGAASHATIRGRRKKAGEVDFSQNRVALKVEKLLRKAATREFGSRRIKKPTSSDSNSTEAVEIQIAPVASVSSTDDEWESTSSTGDEPKTQADERVTITFSCPKNPERVHDGPAKAWVNVPIHGEDPGCGMCGVTVVGRTSGAPYTGLKGVTFPSHAVLKGMLALDAKASVKEANGLNIYDPSHEFKIGKTKCFDTYGVMRSPVLSFEFDLTLLIADKGEEDQFPTISYILNGEKIKLEWLDKEWSELTEVEKQSLTLLGHDIDRDTNPSCEYIPHMDGSIQFVKRQSEKPSRDKPSQNITCPITATRGTMQGYSYHRNGNTSDTFTRCLIWRPSLSWFEPTKDAYSFRLPGILGRSGCPLVIRSGSVHYIVGFQSFWVPGLGNDLPELKDPQEIYESFVNNTRSYYAAYEIPTALKADFEILNAE